MEYAVWTTANHSIPRHTFEPTAGAKTTRYVFAYLVSIMARPLQAGTNNEIVIARKLLQKSSLLYSL